MNVSVQREIMPGTSVTFWYFRRDYKNMIWSDNIAIDPSDYTKYTVQNPLRYDADRGHLQPEPREGDRVQPARSATRTNKRTYTGYDINFQSRMKGLNIFGGFSAGHTISNTCQVEDPNFLTYCDQTNDRHPDVQPVQAERVVQRCRGSSRSRHRSRATTATRATAPTTPPSIPATTMVDPSLRVIWNVDRPTFLAATAKAGYNNGAGVPLTQSSVNIQLIAPGTKFLDRQNQADIRLKRPFNIGRLQLEGQFDAYNAFNSGVVLSRVQTFGTALDRPASILQGRLIRLGRAGALVGGRSEVRSEKLEVRSDGVASGL